MRQRKVQLKNEEELFLMKGYVVERQAEIMIVVVRNEKSQPIKLALNYRMFEAVGVVAHWQRFVYRTFRRENKIISEVTEDKTPYEGERPDFNKERRMIESFRIAKDSALAAQAKSKN